MQLMPGLEELAHRQLLHISCCVNVLVDMLITVVCSLSGAHVHSKPNVGTSCEGTAISNHVQVHPSNTGACCKPGKQHCTKPRKLPATTHCLRSVDCACTTPSMGCNQHLGILSD